MQVQVNKEFRDYSESIFFGLNLRQLIFSALAIGVAVGSYFLLRDRLGTETLSWLCILLAAPFAVLGFVKYNGMTAEKFVWAYIKSEFIMPAELKYKGENKYYSMLDESNKTSGKRGKKNVHSKKNSKKR
jgi:hypothetical protein